jgi:cobalt-zinc-cadmium efflux system membrane fusion protein
MVLITLSCSSPNKPAEQESAKETTKDRVTISPEQAKNITLEMGTFDETMISDEVKSNGVVDVPPMNMASVSIPISGYIKSTSILPGSPVNKGMLLALIYSMDYIQLQQDYLQAFSKLKFLGQELDRQTVLNQEDVGAKRKLQQAESEAASTKAQVKALALKLEMLGCNIEELKKNQISSTIKVISPIDGFVKKANLSIGKNVAPVDVLFEIVGNTHKHLELKVFEKDITKIRKGQQIIVESPQFGNSPILATVFLVGKTVEPDTKTISIHGHLLSEAMEEKLTVGQYVNAKILTGNTKAKTLPETAIVRHGEGGFIFIQLKPNIFQQIPVKLGLQEKGNVMVYPEKNIDNTLIVKQGASILQAILSGSEEE